MKIRCLECKKIHLTEGWVSLQKPKHGTDVCEIHMTCSCLNRMTVEHQHPSEFCYRETKKVTSILGCELVDGPGMEVDYYHTVDDVLHHYFDKAEYDHWNTSTDNERYYSD